jgi:hypothetical protein
MAGRFLRADGVPDIVFRRGNMALKIDSDRG